MAIIKASFRSLVGAVIGVGSAVALTPAFAAFTTAQDTITAIIMMSLVLLRSTFFVFLRQLFAERPVVVFSAFGMSIFALPISAFLLTGKMQSFRSRQFRRISIRGFCS